METGISSSLMPHPHLTNIYLFPKHNIKKQKEKIPTHRYNSTFPFLTILSFSLSFYLLSFSFSSHPKHHTNTLPPLFLSLSFFTLFSLRHHLFILHLHYSTTMKDEWLRAAISDDTIVADLLLRLKQSPPSSSSSSFLHSQRQTQPQTAVFILKPLPPSWGLRQPRSKPSSTSSSSFFDKKRRSPTTPLSWTGGGASPSEGCDESLSSHHHPPPPSSDRSRSKVSASTEAATTTTNKRPRRKKTFAELKEEENSLMKERTHLKKELATLRGTLKEQRSINEKLKRMKVDLQSESRIKSEANSVDEGNNVNNGISEAASSSVTRQDKVEDASEPVSSPSQKCATSQDALFMLPDLNMVPEEDSIVGMSS